MGPRPDRTPIRQNLPTALVDSIVDADPHSPEPARGPAAVADALTRSGAFVECVFSCPSCGLGGTSLIRPGRLAEKSCLACGEAVVVTVLDRFPRR
jgi:hypothetical protein